MSVDPQTDFKSESDIKPYSTSSIFSGSKNDTAEELAKNLDKIKNYIAELREELLGDKQGDSFQSQRENNLDNSDHNMF